MLGKQADLAQRGASQARLASQSHTLCLLDLRLGRHPGHRARTGHPANRPYCFVQNEFSAGNQTICHTDSQIPSRSPPAECAEPANCCLEAGPMLDRGSLLSCRNPATLVRLSQKGQPDPGCCHRALVTPPSTRVRAIGGAGADQRLAGRTCHFNKQQGVSTSWVTQEPIR